MPRPRVTTVWRTKWWLYAGCRKTFSSLGEILGTSPSLVAALEEAVCTTICYLPCLQVRWGIVIDSISKDDSGEGASTKIYCYQLCTRKETPCYKRYTKNAALTLLTWRIWWLPNNAGKWQMGFNSGFKGLICRCNYNCKQVGLQHLYVSSDFIYIYIYIYITHTHTHTHTEPVHVQNTD